MRNYYQHLAPYIDGLAAMNLEVQADVAEYKPQISPATFAEEFQTVGVLVPRRTGKTTYINSRAQNGDVIIVPLHSMRYLYDPVRNDEGVRVLSVGQLSPDRNRGTKPNLWGDVGRVYIDEPMMMRRAERAAIYATFGGRAKQFILIGTP